MIINKKSEPLKAIFIAVALVLGLAALAVFYSAFSKGNTELRSKASAPSTWPQGTRQIFLNNEGTKFYYRTCDWNYNQGIAVNCEPANTWAESPIADTVDPRTLNPVDPRIRDFNSFIYDAVENGRAIQKIRRSYLNDSGTVVYYRTCNWNVDLARSEKCQPENTPWTALPLDQIRGASSTPIYRKFTSFVYDRGNNIQQGIRQILLDNTGTNLYYRTCLWDAERATPVSCGPVDSWNRLPVGEAIGNRSITSIREYSAFIYDVYSSAGVKSQNIRQLFFNEQGNTVFYRTCRWNPVRASVEKCTPTTGWLNTTIINATGTTNRAYLGYNVFMYDMAQSRPLPTNLPPPTDTPWPTKPPAPSPVQ